MLVGPGCYLIYVKNIILPFWFELNTKSVILLNICVFFGFWLYYKSYSKEPGIITN